MTSETKNYNPDHNPRARFFNQLQILISYIRSDELFQRFVATYIFYPRPSQSGGSIYIHGIQPITVTRSKNSYFAFPGFFFSSDIISELSTKMKQNVM